MQKSYKELYSAHAEYDPLQNHKLCLLYEGGFAIQKEAPLFLEQLKGLESGPAYQARLKCSAYIPYLWEFTSEFSSSLFSETLEVKPTEESELLDDYYAEFIKDCDLNGTSLHAFFHNVFERALYELQVYVGLDFPKSDELPNSLLEEESLGLSKGYAYTVPYNNVIDWKCDPKSHKFIWVKMYEECFPNDNPLTPRVHYFQFKIWTVVNGKGHWQLWVCANLPIDKEPTVNTKYTLMEEGDVSFPEIPLYKFCIPKSYHLGMQEGALCQEHYQRRSFMVSNANKTCVSIGVVTLGPDMGAPGDTMPPDIQPVGSSNEVRKKLESDGWVVTRQTDKWADKVEIVEAKGESHKFVSDELTKLVEAMMQTLRQMHMTARASLGAAQQRTAASKMIDQHGVSMLLSVYERIVKDFVRKFFISLAAGRTEEIDITVEGLSTAEQETERKDTIAEVTGLGIDILKMPAVFKNKYLFGLAMDLLKNDMDDEEKMELQEELMKSIQAGDFDAEDPEAIAAAGAAKPGAAKPGDGADPADPTNAALPSGGAGVDPKTMSDRSVSTAGVASSVMKQLKPDYDKKLLQWIPAAHWIQMDVPMDQIDDSNRDKWEASKDQSKVDSMSEAMKDGWSKPIVLVNEPNANKLQLTDGHHRFLASEQNGEKTINAYVAYVGGVDGPWQEMHDLQKEGVKGGKSNQKSNQSNQKT